MNLGVIFLLYLFLDKGVNLEKNEVEVINDDDKVKSANNFLV